VRRILVIATAVLMMLLPSAVSLASPGQPDRQMHPYVGVIVNDLGDGHVDPYCHITLISSTEAVTAHHCAPTGTQITFTFDNPVLVPAQLHTGVTRLGGWDYGDYEADVAIVDLETPIQLPRYAHLPSQSITYTPGDTLDYVTYVGQSQAAQVPCSVAVLEKCIPNGFPYGPTEQREPAHVEYDRNMMRTTPTPNSTVQSDETLVTNNPTCFGNSGSPVFLNGTDIIVGVLSSGAIFCTGGGDSYFARTDSELALGILTGTIPPPPPPVSFPSHVEGFGASGMLSFPATIVAGSEYTGSVIGLTPATETAGSVDQGLFEIFPVSVTPGFRSFLAALRNEYTTGPDLDVYLVWYVDGQPITFSWSGGPTSDETALLTAADIQFISQYGVDGDPYSFEIWINGYDTGGNTATFTLFTDELNQDEGNLTVSPTTASPNDPNINVDLTWSGLDVTRQLHFGLIDHYIDGVPLPPWESTYVEISVSP
jgi:hypothetical protein